jgi:uncharacterized membrane protein YdbT with pleckstrin-like domain
MSYVSTNLDSNETVTYEARLTSIYKIAAFIWGILLFWTIIGPLIAVGILTNLATTEIAVTSKRVIYKRGWIGRRADEINLSKVESVHVDQGIIGRVLGYGTVQVRGTGAGTIKIKWMDNPIGFRKAIQSLA